MRRAIIAAPFAALLLNGCATSTSTGAPAVEVTARVETAPVGTTDQDAADDPAIWRNAADPGASLIVATDKKAGLHVYDLAGREMSFLAAPGLNNVDLVELADGTVLVFASDRADLIRAHAYLARLDTASGRLEPLGRVEIGAGEGYGICLGDSDSNSNSDRAGTIEVFSPVKQGTVYRTLLSRGSDGKWRGTSSTAFAVPTQPEGCVYDTRTGKLYVGEERAGIWVYDRKAGNARLVAPVDNRQLVADVEGLALAPEGEDGGWLVVSSQGDNAYARYSLPDMMPSGRFRIVAGQIDATEETDGIALDKRDFGAQFPHGLFIAQDGNDVPISQNFKLVSWHDVMVALDK